jgi:NADH:ubiquinone reductase (H+-translocating)
VRALILAFGVTANFFGIPGAAEHARTTYTRAAAIGVRDRVLGNLEAYAQGSEGAVEPVAIVVGGGPTGVEMAGALAELRNAGLAYAYPEVDPERVRVVLVEMTDEVLAPFDPKLREYAAGALRERGVELRLGVAVREVRPDCVVLSDGERVPSASTIWATGVKVDDAVSAWGLPQGRGGRLRVGPDLRVEGHPEIFAVGDLAADRDAPLPQLARPAIDGGRHAAAQVRRLLAGEPTEPFVYRDRGISATIGRSDAVIQLPFGLKLPGLVAWLGWVGLHVVLLIGTQPGGYDGQPRGPLPHVAACAQRHRGRPAVAPGPLAAGGVQVVPRSRPSSLAGPPAWMQREWTSWPSDDTTRPGAAGCGIEKAGMGR